MTQPQLPFEEEPQQLSFEDAFKDAWHRAAPNAPVSAAGRPIAPEHAEFEVIPLSEEFGNADDDDPNPNQVPAPLTLVPTSSINPERPRTVAAGYDFKLRTITVIFRHQGRDDDDLPYNYYEVDGREWNTFKTAYSKGRYIKAHLDSHPRGFAEASSVSPFMAAAFAAIALQQKVQQGLQFGQTTKSGKPLVQTLEGQARVRGGKRAYAKGNQGGTGRTRSQSAALVAATNAYESARVSKTLNIRPGRFG